MSPRGSHRVFAVGLVVVLVGVLALSGGALAQSDDRVVEPCAAEPPDDYADPDGDTADVIGWVDGYWYNEPLEINATGGVSEDELERLSARSAARFEAMRCLTYQDGLPPVEIITREEFTNETAEHFADVDNRTAQFDNAMFETMLVIGEDENSIEVREEDRTVTVGGYYDFEEKRIAVISDDPDSLLIDEEILAHELGHALQDQHFDLGQYDRSLHDRDKGILGVIEGDVHRIEHEYLEHCENERWEEPCVSEDLGADGDEDDPVEPPPNWGLYFMEFQPYSDGPSFVEHVYEEGGWAAVDDLYDDVPGHSIYVINPETYDDLALPDLEVADESTDDWERVTLENAPDHEVVGQGGMTAMFVAPTYESEGVSNVLDPVEILNVGPDGEIDTFDPVNYDHPETSGWRGDRLYVFERDGETATVWKTAWADEREATRFAEAYEDLVHARDGERVDGYDNVYAFDEDTEFDMVVGIETDGDRTWIVTAPTVDALTEVHGEFTPIDETGAPADDGEASASETDDGTTGDDGSTGGDAGGDDTGDDEIPGFGFVTAIVAAVVGLGIANRRR